MVSGLVCSNVYKLVQGDNKLDLYKNGFEYQALSLFAFSAPMPTPKQKYKFQFNGEQEYLNCFNNDDNLEITIYSHGVCMLNSRE